MPRLFEIYFANKAYRNDITHHVGDAYCKVLQQFNFRKYARIDLILYTPGDHLNFEFDGDFGRYDDTMIRQRMLYDGREFAQLTIPEKIKKIYELAFASMDKLAIAKGLDPTPFERAKKYIIEQEYKIAIPLSKKIKSPDGRHWALMKYEFTGEYNQISVDIFGKGKLVVNIPIIQAHMMGMYFTFFYQFSWRDDQTFMAVNWTNEIFFLFNISAGNMSISFAPLGNTRQELENLLTGLQYDTPEALRSKYWGGR